MEYDWECEKCGKRYPSKKECDAHEENCKPKKTRKGKIDISQKEQVASILAVIGTISYFFIISFFGLIGIVMIIFYLYYIYRIFFRKEPPKHKDWPWAIILLFIVQVIFTLINYSFFYA